MLTTMRDDLLRPCTIYPKNMMKNRLMLVLLVATTCTALSCKKNENVSGFTGAWGGAYGGDDYGMWRFKVGSDGKVSGSGNSLWVSTLEFTLEGRVSDDGQFRATTGGSDIKWEFTGTFTRDGHVEGTWKSTSGSPAMEGMFSGNRD